VQVLKPALAYGAAAVVCLLILTAVLKLWRVDLRVPLTYSGDSIQMQSWFKGAVENGWYLHNDRLAMPFGQDMHDFPMAEALHFSSVKLLDWATGSWVLAFNLYYLLTFLLSTWTAMFVLRRFGVGYPIAAAVGLLFAFSPYHLWRDQHHYCLSAYYLVPLMVLLALRLYQGQPPFARLEPGENGRRWHLTSAQSLGAVLVCVLVGAGGVYYAFFGCFFLLVAAVLRYYSERRSVVLASAAALIGLVVATLALQALPLVLYRAANGPNPVAVHRWAAESESYGLRIAQMVLPVTNHRCPVMARLKAAYDAAPRANINENDSAALGLVGTAGFAWLLARLFLRRQDGATAPRLDEGLAQLNAAALLLATMGGFGAVLSLFGLTWIRCYNRISVYIGFLSLFAVALLLNRARDRWGLKPTAVAALSAALLVVGIADQCGRRGKQGEKEQAEFRSDSRFVRRVEAGLPEGAMVYQLPQVDFVEHDPPQAMQHYDAMRPYLHSRSLRWSYGALRGRYPALWQQWLTGHPVEAMVEKLAAAGFAGVWVDRHGYADRGAAVEAELTRLAGPGTVSEDNRFAFFKLDAYARRVDSQTTEGERELKREAALSPLAVLWCNGFWEPCRDPRLGEIRWCDRSGELHIFNTRGDTRRGRLSLTLNTFSAAPHSIRVEGLQVGGDYKVSDPGQAVSWLVEVPPGKHVIRFRCDGPSIQWRGDPRRIHFAILNASFREEP
jgi:phosphoglycerol transferase